MIFPVNRAEYVSFVLPWLLYDIGDDDERTDDYFVNDLNINYNLNETNKLYLNITNLFNEKYETARDYSQMPRTFNFGLKNSF